ncbi:DUF1330 domain-containing protein [Catenuloplanes atrovinosus]|uniref:Uncharacterized protein (DUF1330 family) n=1 Tax=Catenuloplanes atrovinosus TaxID=137266 RepID=A0AAE4C9X0_9ACTN|nr:DUF1330 domain-containing protein [Catenuloplanes atrovinosus]MDR7277001.1 uncharacterized protein (DUF1330 family) [Catenuloplanes atrovinosus]
MTAYVIIDLDVTDSAGFREYAEAVLPMIRRAGGRPLVSDRQPVVLEGDWTPSTVVMYEFPDREAAERFWHSPEYQPLKELRRRYATVRVVVAENPPRP